MDKKLLRKEILKIRNNIDISIRNLKDEHIYNIFINSDLYKEVNSIFIYVSFGSEVKTHKIIEKALKDKKRVYVPKTYVDKKEMVAVEIHSLSELIVDNYGILEPKTVEKYKISNKFDVVVIPGVAFDNNGNRIGYGGGYYDKYIKENLLNVKKIALAYEEQIIEHIENDIHDMKVDYIVNSKKIIKIY